MVRWLPLRIMRANSCVRAETLLLSPHLRQPSANAQEGTGSVSEWVAATARGQLQTGSRQTQRHAHALALWVWVREGRENAAWGRLCECRGTPLAKARRPLIKKADAGSGVGIARNLQALRRTQASTRPSAPLREQQHCSDNLAAACILGQLPCPCSGKSLTSNRIAGVARAPVCTSVLATLL